MQGAALGRRSGAPLESVAVSHGADIAGIDAEYRLLREEAGQLRRADLAVIEVVGAEGAEFLQGQLTNDIEALEPGAGCYAALLDRKGKIRSDMVVLREAPDRILIVLPEAAAGRRSAGTSTCTGSAARPRSRTRRRPRGLLARRTAHPGGARRRAARRPSTRTAPCAWPNVTPSRLRRPSAPT